jgi:hypothetical protein
MAPALALAVLVDVSAEMAQAVRGHEAAGVSGPRRALDVARELAQAVLTRCTANASKKTMAYLGAFGSDRSVNLEFARQRGCAHVESCAAVSYLTYPVFQELLRFPALLQPSAQATADLGSALRVATVAMRQAIGTKKYVTRILVITNGRGVQLRSLREAVPAGDLDRSARYELCVLPSAEDDLRAAACRDAVAEILAPRLNARLVRPAALFEDDFVSPVDFRVAFKGVMHISPEVAFYVHAVAKTVEKKAPSLGKASRIALDRIAAESAQARTLASGEGVSGSGSSPSGGGDGGAAGSGGTADGISSCISNDDINSGLNSIKSGRSDLLASQVPLQLKPERAASAAEGALLTSMLERGSAATTAVVGTGHGESFRQYLLSEAVIKREVKLVDPSNPEVDIAADEIAKGYRFGRQIGVRTRPGGNECLASGRFSLAAVPCSGL